jgi:type III secretion protein D
MFELRVLTGLHQGAALPLIGEQWLIGSDAALDLALHDPGVAQRHCRLQRSGEHWSLNAEDGTVVDEEGHAHPVTLLAPGSPFVLGSVWLAVTPAEAAWPTLPVPVAATADAAATETASPPHPVKARRSVFNRATLVMTGILIGVVGSAWSLSRSTAPLEPSVAVPQATGSLAAPAMPAGAVRTRLNAEQARLKLKTMLSDRLLSDINVEATPKGLVLTGSLQEDARPVYQRMLQRFEGSYESALPLIDEVGAGGTALPFVIVQILSGPQAHLVTADGKRLYIGDALDGLRLTRIDDGRVEFEGDRHYEVRW